MNAAEKLSRARWIGGAGNAFARCEFDYDGSGAAVLAIAADRHSYLRELDSPGQTDGWILGGSLVKYRIFVNGAELFTGPLRPCRDDAPTAQEFDLAGHLRRGRNTLGVISRGEKNGFAAVLSLGDVEIATGTEVWRLLPANDIFSPYDWECPALSGTCYRGGPGPGEPFEFIAGDLYPHGWSEAGFDDRGWREAPGREFHCDFETVDVEAVPVTPVRPASVTRIAGGAWLVDFGREYFGSLRLTLPDAATVTLRFGEELTPGGRVLYALRTGNFYETRWRFPEGGATLSGFGLRAFRWAEILGCPELTAAAVELLAVYAPFDDAASSFECSDPRLVRVWTLCKNSLRYTNYDCYCDCPTRERMAYEADAWVAMATDLAMQPNYRFARRAVAYQLRHPTAICEWRQLLPLMVEEYTMHSGDLSLARESYAMLVECYSFRGHLRDGLLVEPPELPALIDWPKIYCDYRTAPVNAVPNAYAYGGFRSLGRLARLIGRDADARDWERLAEELRAAFAAAFFDPADGLVRDHAGTGHKSFHAGLFALSFGVLEDRERAAGFLAASGMACSVYGAQHLLNALFDAGRAADAVALMASDGPRSWIAMMDRLHATVCTEAWCPEEKPNMSFAHPWSSSPGNVICRKLFGLRPTAPGWEEYGFEPNPGGVERGVIVAPTPRGALRAEFGPDKRLSCFVKK